MTYQKKKLRAPLILFAIIIKFTIFKLLKENYDFNSLIYFNGQERRSKHENKINYIVRLYPVFVVVVVVVLAVKGTKFIHFLHCLKLIYENTK